VADFHRNLYGATPATTEQINEIVRGATIREIRQPKFIDPDSGGEGVWLELVGFDSLIFIATPTVATPLWEAHYDATGVPAATLDLALIGILGAAILEFPLICEQVKKAPMVGIRPATFEDTTGGEVRRVDLGDGEALVFHAHAPGQGLILVPGRPRATATVQPFLVHRRNSRLKGLPNN